jgi:nicotinamide mononucleotide transporter
MNLLEAIAAVIGALSVYLGTRQHIAYWPTAIVNVGLYTYVFWRTGLYADAGLQVVFLVLSIYGWYEWLHGGANRAELRVSRATPRTWLIVVPTAIVFWYALARYVASRPGVSLPYLDAGLTTVSLVAQWMTTRKILENWILWIVVDLVYVPVYVYKDLPVTAVLYAVFLALAVLGYREWRRSYRSDRALNAAVS